MCFVFFFLPGPIANPTVPDGNLIFDLGGNCAPFQSEPSRCTLSCVVWILFLPLPSLSAGHHFGA